MSLNAGVRLGSYEILAAIGAGGMGEVYRARDSKLDRDVAIKVLPESFALDADRVARFTREAKTLASLSHPNIAQIFGIEESGGLRALVMELVEGEDLSAHIAGGPMSLGDALPIAKQVAEALEAAHEQGIIHRDLKPANIKVKRDGTVKVLDFGLAKAADAAAGGNAANSPTLTARATQLGMILGTAAYMAPEQARGKAVDKRADIWAFGAVLYEMLTGRRAFQGDEISDVLAAVLRQDVDWNALPPATPRPLRRLLERCLHRDVKTRLRDIGEARVALEQLVGGASEEVGAALPTGAVTPARALVLTSVATALVVASAAWALLPPMETTPSVVQAIIPMPAGLSLSPSDLQSVAVSATHVAFVAGSNHQLFVRALAGAEATPVADATDTDAPFFSPDGQWLAFFVTKGKRLKRVPVAGGPVSDLCEASSPYGADWGPAGIVFADRGKGIYEVSGDCSTQRLVIAPDKNTVLLWPSWLPGGRAILYTEASRIGTGTFDLSGAKLRALSLDEGATPTSVVDGHEGRFVPPHSLVFERGGALVGMRFDSSTRTASGGIETLFSDVAGYGVSPDGTLVFQPGGALQRTYVWVDRQHHVEPTGIPPQGFMYPRISPDGMRVAIASESADRDLWIWDLRQRALTRLTTGRGASSYPVWTPDGRRLIYAGTVNGGNENLVIRAADGTGGVEVLLSSDRHQTPYTTSPDGEFVVFRDEVPGRGTDLGLLRMSTRQAKPLIATPFNERDAEISPDGRLIAYQSDETGRMEIYVRPFPNVDAGKKLVSSGGGIRPCWSRDSRWLFYTAPPATINSVERRAGGPVDFGPPEIVFDATPYWSSGLLGRTYDVAADGRFLMPSDASTGAMSTVPGVSLVLNWARHLSTNR
jgi:Tol biopolymer transport system component